MRVRGMRKWTGWLSNSIGILESSTISLSVFGRFVIYCEPVPVLEYSQSKYLALRGLSSLPHMSEICWSSMGN